MVPMTAKTAKNTESARSSEDDLSRFVRVTHNDLTKITELAQLQNLFIEKRCPYCKGELHELAPVELEGIEHIAVVTCEACIVAFWLREELCP